MQRRDIQRMEEGSFGFGFGHIFALGLGIGFKLTTGERLPAAWRVWSYRLCDFLSQFNSAKNDRGRLAGDVFFDRVVLLRSGQPHAAAGAAAAAWAREDMKDARREVRLALDGAIGECVGINLPWYSAHLE
ncbi:hypothetical protein BDZ91DRAFT_833271 [Kalaharituber pfeilii]|nr:hypothetical protein BDZ91DRAFT_833271 [Kalaharituber pfeilii]